ncbi:MAG TPA: AI-2E family transporter, partial [Pseudomonadales bacterium]
TVIFILAEASSFSRKLASVLSDPDKDLPQFARFGANVNRYIAIKTSTSLATGALVSLSLLLIGVDFPILWGLVAFLLNYVPNIGSFIAAVPALLLALIQLGPGYAAAATGCYLAINIVMGNVVEPRYMGRGLGLSTLVVFLSLVVWGWLLGPVGMFLSVPLTMTAKIALESNPNSQWLALLLSPAESVRETGKDDDAGRQGVDGGSSLS